MISRLQIIMLAVVLSVGLTDAVWAFAGHFDIDAPAYAGLALLSAALAAGGIYYDRIRAEPGLSAMLIGAGFMIAFSAAFSVFNMLLLTVSAHRIDYALAAIDRSLGFYWPAMVAWSTEHPLVNLVLRIAYTSVLPQIALMILCLGTRPMEIYRFCFAVMAGAAMAIGVWAFARAMGTLTVYELPRSLADHISLACDPEYGRQMIWMAAHGPGHISPSDTKGLIAFPSYHAVLALLVAWHARKLAVIRWIALALNAVVLVATPIQGGHHVVDVFAGAVTAVLAILFSNAVLAYAARARPLRFAGPEPATS